MKASVDLDDELAAEVEKTGSMIHEKPDAVLRLAIQAGLPLLIGKLESLRPEGYFASDYPLPEEWLELETAMAKVPQHLDG